MARRAAIVATCQTHHRSIRRDVNGQELINEAVTRCLEDGELSIEDIDAVVIGNMDHFEGINYADCWSVDGSGGFMKPTIKLTTGGTTGTTLRQAGTPCHFITEAGCARSVEQVNVSVRQQKFVIIQRIKFRTDLKLLEIVQAGHFPGFFPCQRKHRLQKRCEKCDYRDNDQKLYQRESRQVPSYRRSISLVRELAERNWPLSPL